MTGQHPFIKERLESLSEVDAKLVSILNNASLTLTNLVDLKSPTEQTTESATTETTKKEFETNLNNFFKDIEQVSKQLKSEIVQFDERIDKIDSNGITLLPININKKSTWVGEEKLKNQLEKIEQLYAE